MQKLKAKEDEVPEMNHVSLKAEHKARRDVPYVGVVHSGASILSLHLVDIANRLRLRCLHLRMLQMFG